MIYELIIIAKENNTAEELADIKSTIEKWGAIHIEEDNGVERLVYPIGIGGIIHNFGHYLFYTVDINKGDPQKLSGELNTKDSVLRCILVKQKMKYFKVELRQIKGDIIAGEVDCAGEIIDLPDIIETNETHDLGYVVYELDEGGDILGTIYGLTLDEIKKEYSADNGWQNNNW